MNMSSLPQMGWNCQEVAEMFNTSAKENMSVAFVTLSEQLVRKTASYKTTGLHPQSKWWTYIGFLPWSILDTPHPNYRPLIPYMGPCERSFPSSRKREGLKPKDVVQNVSTREDLPLSLSTCINHSAFMSLPQWHWLHMKQFATKRTDLADSKSTVHHLCCHAHP